MNRSVAAKQFSLESYLRAKVSVDARAFNQGEWDQLVHQIRQAPQKRIQGMELGGGIGTKAKKFIDQFEQKKGSYLIVEQNPSLMKMAKSNLVDWADEMESDVNDQPDASIAFRVKKGNWTISFLQLDIQSWMAIQNETEFLDVVIGHAILDLLDSRRLFKDIYPLLSKEAVLYFPINYDGLSIFEPVVQARLDEEIWRTYNQSMDQRVIDGKISGDSQSGRHLFGNLENAGLKVISAGSSDWLVFPKDRQYIGEEGHFLNHIINTIENELSDHPLLDQRKFRDWIRLRKEQVLSGKLIYMAHQIDVLAVRQPDISA